jgi:glycine/D-amino acid oxidase-like deaminating enzyme
LLEELSRDCTEQEKSDLFKYPVEILRPLLKESDVLSWLKSAKTTSQGWLEEVSDEDFQRKTGFTMQQARILKTVKIKNSIVVNPTNYLLTLWQHVQRLCPSTKWQLDGVSNLDAVTKLSQSFDIVVLAVGPTLQHLWSDRPEHQFFLKYVKGQNQLYQNGKSTESLTGPLLSGEYIVPRSEGGQHYLVCGATHTHIPKPTVEDLKLMINSKFIESPTDLEIDGTLRSRLTAMYPPLQNTQLFQLTSGIRLVTERTELGKIPIVGRHPWLDNVWTLAGLGARGLVYHALMSKYLSKAILDNDANQHIPHALHPSSHYK